MNVPQRHAAHKHYTMHAAPAVNLVKVNSILQCNGPTCQWHLLHATMGVGVMQEPADTKHDTHSSEHAVIGMAAAWRRASPCHAF